MQSNESNTENTFTFSDLNLSEPLLKAIHDIGYETPSPIQAASIPHLLAGFDIIGQAQTGTGKTAAFALPILNKIDTTRREPQALVLTPTRELALQVAEAFQSYARHIPDFHILPIYGGQGMETQLRQLRRGVHVIVGTPGRVIDHLRRGTLSLEGLTTLVLDEADEMLKMGFIDDVEWVLEQSPPERQIALFSATMPDPIRKVATRHLHEPKEAKIEAKTATVEAIEQRYWPVTGTNKLDALTRILEVEDFDGMLIFVRTKIATEELAEKLEARGYSASPLNGDMSQMMREKTVDRLKKGALDILVATDVAARGLDVDRISHVVNYDIPYDTEAYIHRIGRTGRAGRTGNAILFVAPRERRMLTAIERATRHRIREMHLPTRSDIAERRVEQFKELVMSTLEAEELSFYREFVLQLAQERELEALDIASALTFLAQKDRPLVLPQGHFHDHEEGRDRKRGDRGERGDRGDRGDRGGDRRDRRDRDFGGGRDRDFGGRDRGGDRFPSRDRDFDRGSDRSPPRDRDFDDSGTLYRIEVGRLDGVGPREIVGAIANEAGIPGKSIGHIKLYDEFSTVSLPPDVSKQALKRLERTFIMGKPIHISLWDGDVPPRSSSRKRSYPSKRDD